MMPLEGVGPNVPVFHIELVLNDFEAGKSITRAVGKGWALEISTFWAHLWASLVAISGPQKSLDFQGSPLLMFTEYDKNTDALYKLLL